MDIKTDPGVKTDYDGGFKTDPDRNYVKAEKMDDWSKSGPIIGPKSPN